MAKIAVFSFSNCAWTKERYTDSFVEGFEKKLVEYGNDVLNIQCNFNKGKILKKVLDFNPELIITFNNYISSNNVLLETNCPIALFASDSPAFFANKDLIKKYQDRYYFFNFSNDTIKAIPEHFPFINKNKIILFGQNTAIKKEDINQDINISFVGSIANWNNSMSEYFKNIWKYSQIKESFNPNLIKDSFFEAIEKLSNNPFLKIDKNTLPCYDSVNPSIEADMILLLTANKRFKYLSQFTDLGLKVFSHPISFPDVLNYNYDLFKCFDFSTCITMEQNSNVYNRSKISLNLPHAHAKEGFSWRVCDILASNSVLLSTPQPQLIDLMKGYAKLPTYESEAEAREIAVKLLKDDIWRNDLVIASQQMIEDKCRFKDKFKIMEKELSVSLFNETKGNIDTLISIKNDNKRFAVSKKRTFFQKALRELCKILPYFLVKNIFIKR